MEIFLIHLPQSRQAEPESTQAIAASDLECGRQILAEFDPYDEYSFAAFSISDLECDVEDCKVEPLIVVAAVHPEVRRTKLAAFCPAHAECLRVAITLRKPGEIGADEVERLYAEMQRERGG